MSPTPTVPPVQAESPVPGTPQESGNKNEKGIKHIDISKPADEVVNAIGDMKNVGGSGDYGNYYMGNDLEIGSLMGNSSVDYIMNWGNTEVSIYGICIGEHYSDALNGLSSDGWVGNTDLYISSDDEKVFVKDGNTLLLNVGADDNIQSFTFIRETVDSCGNINSLKEDDFLNKELGNMVGKITGRTNDAFTVTTITGTSVTIYYNNTENLEKFMDKDVTVDFDPISFKGLYISTAVNSLDLQTGEYWEHYGEDY